MDKINFQNLPSTETPINADNLNKLQENIEIAIDDNAANIEKNAENITNINKIINNVGKIEGTIPAGKYFQYPFESFCGLAGIRVYTSLCEVFKIYTVTVSNKYAGEIKELTSFEYNENSNVGFNFEIVNGADTDVQKYIRVTNTGSVDLSYQFGINGIT